MERTNRDARKAALVGLDLRLPSLVPHALAFLALLLLAPALFAYAYVVKLKDGSLISARAPYTVKGTRAIITLENGTVTQIPLDEVDQPGTEKYNRENFGNAIMIDTPRKKGIQLPTRAPRCGAASPDSGQSLDRNLRGGPVARVVRQPPRHDGRRSGSLSGQ